MKIIKFTDELTKQILAGKKSSTWRLFDDKDLQNGDIVGLVNKLNLMKFGEAIIESVEIKNLKKAFEEDNAERDKYQSENEMYKELQKYYPDKIISSDTEVKIIKFKITI
jgi:hypothetical protein